ncbi:MAG: UDP-3-O-acyl-N-acetylglucosamine deacetylase [Phycisphaerales bacterium]|jgi:UDP-3-O-[3-hydroxymyristoyl] N-acetylglucosamine deacetylase/3-hydroxyacyl-[acyl-carrier-protein] dehydratase|nr:UDP-3-O-acyl-N-acetylglucosamine deacetylase [Phycisphaerales bacterium]MDP6986910.1 UDP-3-O-acyl-N-acetylglucosamine deacetylase [Phycisphaerales bacterium]
MDTKPEKNEVTEDIANPQQTLRAEVEVSGQGLMHGREAMLRMVPAGPDHGIVFERVDLDPPVRIPAQVEYAIDRDRRTAISNGDAVVETIEHCMSALRGCGIDNVLLQLDGPEVPLGDGSAASFLEAIREVGVEPQSSPRHLLHITEPIILREDDAMLAAFPAGGDEFHVLYELDYGSHTDRIPKQAFAFTLSDGAYGTEVASSRTFSLAEEAMSLQEQGLCGHLSPSDVLVIGEDGPIDNAWRFENEPVRHKVLDLIGDLMLVGGPVCGHFVARKSGHALNRRMCRALREQVEERERQERLAEGRTMDIRAIQQIMPHRYPMLLVDRVVEIDGNTRAVGVKNVTINEPFFTGHYPGTPIMPGVMIVEAMAQLGGLLLSQTLEHTGKIAVLLSLDRVKLRHPVTPGDQLVLEAETIRASTRTASIRCQAHVGPRQVAEAQIRFMMVDADQAHG